MHQRVFNHIGIGDFIQYDRVDGKKAYGVIVEVQHNSRDWQRPVGFTVEWILNGHGMLDMVFASGYDISWFKAEHKEG